MQPIAPWNLRTKIIISINSISALHLIILITITDVDKTIPAAFELVNHIHQGIVSTVPCNDEVI